MNTYDFVSFPKFFGSSLEYAIEKGRYDDSTYKLGNFNPITFSLLAGTGNTYKNIMRVFLGKYTYKHNPRFQLRTTNFYVAKGVLLDENEIIMMVLRDGILYICSDYLHVQLQNNRKIKEIFEEAKAIASEVKSVPYTELLGLFNYKMPEFNFSSVKEMKETLKRLSEDFLRDPFVKQKFRVYAENRNENVTVPF